MEGGVMLSWQPAQSCRDPITSYTVTGANGLSVTLPANQTSLWIPGLVDGTHYTFTVTATNHTGSDSMTSTVAVPGRHCDSAIVTAGASTPQPVGAAIALHATASGCPNPEYQFWIEQPGTGRYQVARPYGGSSWTWDTAGLPAGGYQILVWARQQGSGNQYDTYGVMWFRLTAVGCGSVSLTPSAAAPRPVGSVVTFTASSTRCASPEYEFHLRRSGTGYVMVQPYSSSTTWTFDTTSYPAGTYEINVLARQAGTSTASDVSFVMTYEIRAGGCVISAVTPSVAQLQPAGTSVTFTAQPTGCAKQYKFLLLAPGAKWRVVQNYGASRAWSWNTTGYQAGTYRIEVWAGSSAAPAKYSTYAITTYTLGGAIGCSAVTLSSDTTPPRTSGSSVTLTGAASGSGCTNPTYEFLLLTPGSRWTVMRPWGTAPSWTWQTAGYAPGTYQLGVWARRSGSTASRESFAEISFQIVVPTCSNATISASPNSSAAAGTSVAFSASSTGCSVPRYQFLVAPVGGPWKVVQAFSATSSVTWSTTGVAPGDYQVAVWTQSTGSSNAYDVYAIQQYTVT
jgi:hypothetical protein